MAISGLGVNLSFTPEQLKNINSYQKDLDTSKAIKFQDSPVKDLGIKLKGIDLSQISEGDLIDINLKDVYGQEVNTTNFDWIINHNWELSKDQKTTINTAIQAATDILNTNTTNGDSYGMRISQTNMELKYVGQKFIPEKYLDEYNSYVDKYTQELSDSYVNMNKSMAEDIINTASKSLIDSGWKNRGQDILDSINNGTDVFQTSEREYQKLYSSIDITNPDTVKDQLDAVYKNILTNQTNNWWGKDNTSLSSEVKYLAEKWNSLMDVLGENKNFTTSINHTV